MKDFNMDDYSALKGSTLVKGLAGSEQLRFDSVESATVFFARELDQVKTKTYDKQYPELSALSYFPITSEVNEGAETTTYYSYDITGMAAIINNYATDLPRVDVQGESHTASIKSVGDSYGYNVQEMRASRMAGKSLDARKVQLQEERQIIWLIRLLLQAIRNIISSAFSLMVPTFLCTLCPRLKLMERSTQTGHIRLLIRFLRISMACRSLLTRLQCLSKSLIH